MGTPTASPFRPQKTSPPASSRRSVVGTERREPDGRHRSKIHADRSHNSEAALARGFRPFHRGQQLSGSRCRVQRCTVAGSNHSCSTALPSHPVPLGVPAPTARRRVASGSDTDFKVNRICTPFTHLPVNSVNNVSVISTITNLNGCRSRAYSLLQRRMRHGCTARPPHMCQGEARNIPLGTFPKEAVLTWQCQDLWRGRIRTY